MHWYSWKILVVIGHFCIYWSKVVEGFLVFNAVLFISIRSTLIVIVNICYDTAMVAAVWAFALVDTIVAINGH